jgi:hypothetical protein
VSDSRNEDQNETLAVLGHEPFVVDVVLITPKIRIDEKVAHGIVLFPSDFKIVII